MSFSDSLIGTENGVALGRGANASVEGAIAIGSTKGSPTSGAVTDGAHATADGAIAIGPGAKATAEGAIQIGAGTNATANSIQLASPLMTLPTLAGGAATAAAVLRVGETVTEGLELFVLDKEVTLTNAVSTDVVTLPAGSIPLGGQVNLNTLVEDSGSDGASPIAKIGLGISGTVSKYAIADALTKNTKGGKLVTLAVLGSAEDVKLYALVSAGTASTSKFTAGSKVRVRLYYLALNNLDDEA